MTNDADLAVLGHRLERARLRTLASLVTPDTILRWHRRLVARKWTIPRHSRGRAGVLLKIQQLVVRMVDEPTWGYSRIQGALQVVGHRAGRSTIARILKAHGLPPVPGRSTSWQTFLRAHWGAIAGADFFTSEVWMPPGTGDVLLGHYGMSLASGVHVCPSNSHGFTDAVSPDASDM
jgi:hypothetical protein